VAAHDLEGAIAGAPIYAVPSESRVDEFVRLVLEGGAAA